MNIERRLAAARRRLHQDIDARADAAHAATRHSGAAALAHINEFANHLQRSASARKGWITRRAKGQS